LVGGVGPVVGGFAAAFSGRRYARVGSSAAVVRSSSEKDFSALEARERGRGGNGVL
jgi:hypothetical protein